MYKRRGKKREIDLYCWYNIAHRGGCGLVNQNQEQ